MEWAPFLGDVRLRTADWDGYLARFGLATKVRRAVACPCADPESRRGDPNCTRCAGWGWQYPPELAVENLSVQWVGQQSSEENRREGRVQPGDYTVTWPSTQPLGEGDIFVHPNEEGVTDEFLVRGHVDPAVGTLERLRFRGVTAVEDLRDADRRYAADQDWQFGADGRSVEWMAGGLAPGDGVLYTVRYRYRAEYVIAGGLPKVRHDGGERLPFTARVVRFDPLHLQQGRGLGEGVAP